MNYVSLEHFQSLIPYNAAIEADKLCAEPEMPLLRMGTGLVQKYIYTLNKNHGLDLVEPLEPPMSQGSQSHVTKVYEGTELRR